MKTKRCPWCGKKLSNGSNIWERIKIGIKPVHQCPFCFNPMSSPLSTILYAPILLVLIGFYLNTNTLLFIVYCLSAVVAFALCLLLIIFGKYNARFVFDNFRYLFNVHRRRNVTAAPTNKYTYSLHIFTLFT